MGFLLSKWPQLDQAPGLWAFGACCVWQVKETVGEAGLLAGYSLPGRLEDSPVFLNLLNACASFDKIRHCSPRTYTLGLNYQHFWKKKCGDLFSLLGVLSWDHIPSFPWSRFERKESLDQQSSAWASAGRPPRKCLKCPAPRLHPRPVKWESQLRGLTHHKG